MAHQIWRAMRLAAFVLCLVAGISLAVRGQTPAPPSSVPQTSAPAPQRGGRGGGPPIVSPEIAADRTVTYRLRAPNATQVAVRVAGTRLAMTKSDQGIWSTTSGPLEPDLYAYSFDVDGVTIPDPANRQYETSFNSFQSLLAVPGPAMWLPHAGVAQGAIARHVFHSSVAGDDREFFVYTPASYDARRQRPYPVLYLLHGLGDDAGRWFNGGGANRILDNLIAGGKAEPMIVVGTLGYGTADGPAKAMTPDNVRGYERILLTEIIPVVEREYRAGTSAAERAIAGLSMGGATATYVGLNHPDRFGWIGSFSGAYAMWPEGTTAPGVTSAVTNVLPPDVFDRTFPSLSARSTKNLRLLWIACGTSDGLIALNRRYRDWLTAKGVTFTAIETPGSHAWNVWKQNLTDFAPLLFRAR
jgi:enterochelin esterase family protein